MRNRRGSPLPQLVYPCADPARRGPLAAPSIPPTLPIHTLIPPFSSLRVVCGPLPPRHVDPSARNVDPRAPSRACGPFLLAGVRTLSRPPAYVDPPTPECGPSRL